MSLWFRKLRTNDILMVIGSVVVLLIALISCSPSGEPGLDPNNTLDGTITLPTTAPPSAVSLPPTTVPCAPGTYRLNDGTCLGMPLPTDPVLTEPPVTQAPVLGVPGIPPEPVAPPPEPEVTSPPVVTVPPTQEPPPTITVPITVPDTVVTVPDTTLPEVSLPDTTFEIPIGTLGDPLDPLFANCYEANREGNGYYTQGVDTEYTWYAHEDLDQDGIVCE